MENTLLPGDRVLVSKIVYRFRDIARGDVVVFSGQGSWGPDAPPPPGNPFVRLWDDLTNLIGVTAPGTDYIKRVIGLPGDHVVCCDAQGRITVNGVPLSEQSYIHPGDVPSSVPFDAVVPAGRLWVMGDNRADSDDSRYRTTDPGGGTIPESEVVGRAFVIIWPPSRIGDLPIPATFQQMAWHATAAAPAVLGGTAGALTVGVLAWRRRRAPELGDDSREMGS
jgi:signal peptidase I